MNDPAVEKIPVVDLKGRALTPCSLAKAEQNLQDGLARLIDGVLHLNYLPMAYRKVYRMVRRRDGYTCAWCHGPGSTLEHVLPISWGGRTTMDNCVIACRACNHSRNNALPSQFIAWTGFKPTHPVILRILHNEEQELRKARRSLRNRPIESCASKEEAQIWVAFHQGAFDTSRPAPPDQPSSRFRPDSRPFLQFFVP
ncbi:MAG: HNH endonuclease [Sulfobacillus thermosulfidooxidans]|uniref:HNH endonuclease n=1 Tax=Sulfobacillus thermotolerans TaxID=338644 RepID=A0ABN5H548_9FIRM|nr:HNH endonuclease [Sulfobacillus sp. hq2]AUW95196.1 HNH endonuclease [Sulfobacillus thermotolerans]MCY0909536.1 HNH endonuclease [Sulfobacillus thermotolerans]POB10148.1 HNH endonuclease [Sulfobacillus sp. hq2]PSR36404.1 MAG: HNH endonuclease [Sulfobacillus thermosulfidooxidans]